jgi:hypothetical protein
LELLGAVRLTVTDDGTTSEIVLGQACGES